MYKRLLEVKKIKEEEEEEEEEEEIVHFKKSKVSEQPFFPRQFIDGKFIYDKNLSIWEMQKNTKMGYHFSHRNGYYKKY